MVLVVSPMWERVRLSKAAIGDFSLFGIKQENNRSFEALERENAILQNQVEMIRAWLLHENGIADLMDCLKQLHPQSQEKDDVDFYLRRRKELVQLLQADSCGLFGRVIFREPAFWSSSLWLNVGERDNRMLKKKIVAKNSPVIKGRALVGVVEHVGWRRCRVRLLTDVHLVPSVRAVRGGEQNELLREQMSNVLTALNLRDDLFASSEAAREVLQPLVNLLNTLSQTSRGSYLAKGELQGSGLPLWRCRGAVLQGIGFNYDFADEEGLARELRTGEIIAGGRHLPRQPLLRLGDLLVTTGLDGIFPPGYHVATVSKIAPLNEGACSYSIEAIPTVVNLNDLSDAWVLPPQPAE